MSTPFSFSEPYEFEGDILVDIDDGKTKWMMPADLKDDLPKIYNMEVRKDDLWLLGIPKSGNTWASEMIITVHRGGTEEANQKGHFDRWCFPEMGIYQKMGANKMPEEVRKLVQFKDFIKQAEECQSPRFLRTHLPLSLLPPQLLDTCKVVYLCRNLKDVAVSMFKMVDGIEAYGSSGMEHFVAESFIKDKALFSPMCEPIKEAWRKRHHPNMYFLFYEDMKKDLPGEMRKMATFLGKTLTEEQISELENHLSVETMRQNRNINMTELKEMMLMAPNTVFIRKGVSGDWKNHFTPSMNEQFDQWLSEQMRDTPDFTFKN